jgi:hypothetical protein
MNKRSFFMEKKDIWAKQRIPLRAVFAGLALVLAACSSSPAAQQRSARELAIEMAKPVRASQNKRPDWIDEVPVSASTLSFIGVSAKYAVETQARENAREDGRRQLVDYFGTLMASKGREFSATYGLSNEVFSPQIAGQRLNERIAQGVAQALADRRYYWEYFMDENNREYYTDYVEMQIEKSRVARIIDEFGREEAADLRKKAAAEQDRVRRQQLERTAEFFGGNLSSSLDF